nr:uncharacterized protein LOC129273400 [Lytechinus pictus]XP_054766432.1 uncharacterized protein LOC129273430 [Lytechinus pictus]
MSRRAIQGFEALRNDNGSGWKQGAKGNEKIMVTNNNIPDYHRARKPTSRGTQTGPTESYTWSSSPQRKTTSNALQTLRSRSTSPKEMAMDTTPSVPGCICNREHTSVACCSCGLMLAGRVRIQCPSHPNTIHLMDVERCPECCSATLTELRTT